MNYSFILSSVRFVAVAYPLIAHSNYQPVASRAAVQLGRITLETHQTFELLSQNFPHPIHFLADRT